MVDLKKIESQIPPQTIVRSQGSIIGTSGSDMQLSVNGSIVPFRCIDPVSVDIGDTVAVDIVANGKTGQAEAWVLGRLGNALRPDTGTVASIPPSSSTIVITGADGVSYNASFSSTYTPVVGNVVKLLWSTSTPYAISKLGATGTPPAPPPVVAPPPVASQPPPATTGSNGFAASNSGSYDPSVGWDHWAQQNNQVYQGGGGYGGNLTGCWFYSNSPNFLAGRAITDIKLHLGARLYVGGYNQTATVNVYAHTSPYKPGGAPNLTAGPFSVSVAPGSTGNDIYVPQAQLAGFAAVILSGGGFAIYGDPYYGCNGRNVETYSGAIQIYWKR